MGIMAVFMVIVGNIIDSVYVDLVYLDILVVIIGVVIIVIIFNGGECWSSRKVIKVVVVVWFDFYLVVWIRDEVVEVICCIG